jgi:hypothetical protein
MIVLDLSILNQKGTPMFNSDLTANRPAAGIPGRIFIAIDSPFGIFRDTGTAWDQVSSAGGGAASTIYTSDGTLTANRTVSSGGFNLTFAPQTTFLSSLTASTSASSYSVLGSNALSYAVGFSSSNIGNVYSANGAINAQTFLGNATFAQANLASANVSVNSIDFGSGGHTITMTQSTGIRAMTGHQSQIQFQGSHNGTISHAAISQNLGFYRPPSSTRTLTITNAYSLLLNALDDYGAGFTFTNRWGIYQAGSSDTNYFAGNVLIGQTTSTGQKLQVTGNVKVNTGSNQTLQIHPQTLNSLPVYTGISGGSVSIPSSTNYGIAISDNGNGLFINAGQGISIGLSGTQFLGVSFSTGNIIIQNGGTFTDSGERLQVTGTTKTTAISLSGWSLATESASGSSALNIRTPASGRYFLLSRQDAATGTGNFEYAALSNGDSRFVFSSSDYFSGSPTASCLIQMRSTTQGFQPPTMTTAQKNAIGSPVAGLIVYDTTLNKLCVYTTAWETITSI